MLSSSYARAPARRAALGWLLVALLAATAALAIFVWWRESEEERALRALPEAQRLGLYRRTIENLKTICDPAPGRSMRDFCRDQAAFALQFPDCDTDCKRIARRHLSLPRP